jgi:hypothetical protein
LTDRFNGFFDLIVFHVFFNCQLEEFLVWEDEIVTISLRKYLKEKFVARNLKVSITTNVSSKRIYQWMMKNDEDRWKLMMNQWIIWWRHDFAIHTRWTGITNISPKFNKDALPSRSHSYRCIFGITIIELSTDDIDSTKVYLLKLLKGGNLL